MSRGFVKESDQEELPIIPPRAPLPAGVTNYVTPTGLAQLEAEREQLEAAKAAVPTDHEDERRRALTVLDGKLALLLKRIQSARVINPAEQPRDEVRFGARVTVQQSGSNRKQEFQIVGVDEANVKEKKIAFTAPIARAITGLWVGESAVFKLGRESRTVKVISLDYDH
jgi:transcription elongation factor GreB